MDRSIATAEAPTSPFGLLPDAVLLRIFKDRCDHDTQLAAYGSCRDIRDFCDRHMKSVRVELCPGDSLQEVQELSSKTMCPKYGIESLTMNIGYCYWQEYQHSFAYAEQLVNDTFAATESPEYRREQLANVSKVKLWLPGSADMSPKNCQIVQHVLSQFPKLQRLRTNTGKPMSLVSAPNLQQLICKGRATPEQLQLLAKEQPSLQRLELIYDDQFQYFHPHLLQFTKLQHLQLQPGNLSLLLPARLLTDLTQLTTLSLHYVTILDVHLLQKLSITHLALGKVDSRVTNQQRPVLPAKWPALKHVEFTHTSDPSYPVSETLARAVLPLPHPGFTVTWANSAICYHADIPPHPDFGYMGMAHMKSVHLLYLAGKYKFAAQRALTMNEVTIKCLQFSQKKEQEEEEEEEEIWPDY